MTGTGKVIIEGTICTFSEGDSSVALELSIQQAKDFIVGLLIFNEDLCDFLSIHDKLAEKTLVIKKHPNYKKAVIKGRLRTRSTIVYNNCTWTFLVTLHDLYLIIDWYLKSIVSVNNIKCTSRFDYAGAMLDIECDDNSMMMFATSLQTEHDSRNRKGGTWQDETLPRAGGLRLVEDR